jgi:hypothetical protein
MTDVMYTFEQMYYLNNNETFLPQTPQPVSPKMNPSLSSPASSKPSLIPQINEQIDFEIMFPVKVKTDAETLTFMWNNNTSIEKVFLVVSEVFCKPIDSFYLFFAGKKLQSSSVTLKEVNISRNDLIHCIFKMRGGMLTESSGREGSYKVLNSF